MSGRCAAARRGAGGRCGGSRRVGRDAGCCSATAGAAAARVPAGHGPAVRLGGTAGHSGRRHLSRPRHGQEAGQADGRQAARAPGPGRGRVTIRSVPPRRAWARRAPPRQWRAAPGRARRRPVLRMVVRRGQARRGQEHQAQARQVAARARQAVAAGPAAFRVRPRAAQVPVARQARACPGPAARGRAR